jgi:lipopolysaccharide transport system ATP-binding protein
MIDAVNKHAGLFHITHWKAGSQWIYKILQQCAPDKIVPPEIGMEQFAQAKVLSGDKVYPALYLTRQKFMRAGLCASAKRFVVVRDLRDSVISHYFSLKVSHPITAPEVSQLRRILTSMDMDDGLIFLIRHRLYKPALIQFSWFCAEEPVIKYENLLHHDIDILTPIISHASPLSHQEIEKVIIANRFSALTKNRERGCEDINSHERKAMPGDWKLYFSNRIKDEFKRRYADLLIKMGYETDNNW